MFRVYLWACATCACGIAALPFFIGFVGAFFFESKPTVREALIHALIGISSGMLCVACFFLAAYCIERAFQAKDAQ